MERKHIRNNILQTFRMSLIPTPFQRLENLSRRFSINLFCKRDDLTGFAFGGNKTRKLDFLIQDAKEKHADTLIAVGAVQSNFCRISAAAGKVNGFDVHLVLGGKKQKNPSGNLLISKLFGANIHYVHSVDWKIWEAHARELSIQLIKQGKNIYYLPIGGSTPIGALGYVSAFYEIVNDCKHYGITSNPYIIHASSSGGTQAGLIVGKTLMHSNIRIIGMGVAKTEKTLTNEIYELALQTGKLFSNSIVKKDIVVDNSFMGKSYAVRTTDAKDAIKLFAEEEGILLDHVYTSKAAAGLINYAKRGIFKKKDTIIFLHTGGNIELFE